MSGDLRVLVVSSGYPKAPTDGNFTFVGDHCEALSAQGAQVEVLAYDADTGSDAAPSDHGSVTVHRMPRYRLKTYISDVLLQRVRLPATLDLTGFTHISTQIEVGLPVLREAKRGTSGRVGTSVVIQGQPGVGLREVLWTFLLRRNRRYVDQVFIVGPKLRTSAHRYYGIEPVLLPNGARLVDECPDPTSAQFIRDLATSEVTTVVTVAVQSMRKGIDVLLEALAEAIEGRPRATKAIIVGDGPDLGTFKRLASKLGLDDIVTFTGRLDRAVITGLLRAADIAVLASRKEAYGVAATEAALAECTVLVSDEVDAQFSADPEGSWLIHQAGSAAGLARDLRWCLDNPDAAKQRAVAARRSAEEFGGWERNAQRFLRHIR